MKKVMIILLVIIIFCVGIALAGQKRVRSFDNVEWGGGLGSETIAMMECEEYCNSISENVDRYFADGWQVVSQREISSTSSDRRNYCQCKGVEYILDSGN